MRPVHLKQCRGKLRGKRLHQCDGQSEPKQSACHGEHEILRQQLPEQSRARDAERPAYRKLLLPRRVTRKLQPGDVERYRQQDNPRSSGDEQQRTPVVTEEAVAQRCDGEAPRTIALRILLREPCCQMLCGGSC